MQNRPSLEDYKINVRIKLALLWTTLMSLYIYADYFDLMTPGKLEKMTGLQTPAGPTTPGLLITFSVLLIIPALMIFLSVFLTPWVIKVLNLLFGSIYAFISIVIIINEFRNPWHGFFVLYNIVELIVLGMILWQAWKWPKS